MSGRIGEAVQVTLKQIPTAFAGVAPICPCSWARETLVTRGAGVKAQRLSDRRYLGGAISSAATRWPEQHWDNCWGSLSMNLRIAGLSQATQFDSLSENAKAWK